MNNSQKYAIAFSGSLYGNVYSITQGSSSWVPFSASTREPNEVAMNEIIDEKYYEIFTHSIAPPEVIEPITQITQNFINFTENGYLELKNGSSNIYNSTGAFAIEALFKLDSVPEFMPNEKSAIFKANQEGTYSADFPFIVGFLPQYANINNYPSCSAGSCWIWPKYPVTWEGNRGYWLGVEKHSLPNINTPKLKFIINVKNKIKKGSTGYPLPPWDYIAPFMGFTPTGLTNNPHWKIIGTDDSGLPPVAKSWMTGSAPYMNINVGNWFHQNMLWNPEPLKYEVLSDAVLNYNDWYYVCITYGNHEYTPNLTKIKITIKVKNISTNDEWYNENNDISINDKLLPCYNGAIGTTQSIGSARQYPAVFPDPGLSEGWPWTTNWVNVFWGFNQAAGGAGVYHQLGAYNINDPIPNQKIIISNPSEQFFGDVKYTRFWYKQFPNENTDALELHSGSFNYSNFVNDPNIEIGSLIMFVNMDEGEGNKTYDKSNHGMNFVFKTGSDASDVLLWKSGSI